MKESLVSIRYVLTTIRPIDGVVFLDCDVMTAEEIWFKYVTRRDRKDFELVIEHTSQGCNVFVRPWSESGMITGGDTSWVGWGCIAVCLTFWLVVINYV